MPHLLDRKSVAYLGGVILFFFVYLVAAEIGLTQAYVHNSVSALWPPTGIALAVLLLFGYRLWPGIFLGAFVANYANDVNALSAFGMAIGNTLEAFVGAYLVNRFAGGIRAFDRVRDFVEFATAAGIAGPIISATLGVTSLYIGGHLVENYADVWFTWWLGDAVSALILAPFIILWATNFHFFWDWRRVLELLSLFVLLVIASQIIFGETFLGQRAYPVFLMPLLVWVALRFSPRETVSAVLTIAVVSAWSTLERLGPFALPGPINESLVVSQLFIGVVAITSLVLAVVVAERKKVENALQTADQRKDDFLASLSHELRNPLAAVSGYLQLIKGSQNETERQNALRDMDIELHHVTLLLEDLLDLSRIRRGRMRLHMQPVEITQSAAAAVATVSALIQEQRHTLHVQHLDEKLWVQGDANRIKQVLVNLLNNAAKFTNPGGTIYLITRRRRGSVEVEIRDTGQGISEDKLAIIFDRSPMVDRTELHARAGLGIGLSLVRRLMEMHNGVVRAYSEGAGKGSTFIISFPALSESSTPGAIQGELPLEKHHRKSTPKNILLVDDNIKAANVMGDLLRRMKHDVTVVYDGQSALESVRDHVPDAIILDIGLPDIDGFEVARRIREIPVVDRPRPLLIALSGYGQEEDKRRSKEVGFDEYVVKPVDIEILQEILMNPRYYLF